MKDIYKQYGQRNQKSEDKIIVHHNALVGIHIIIIIS